MKWLAIGVVAAVLALAGGALAFTNTGGSQGTATRSSLVGTSAPEMTAKQAQPVRAARKPGRLGTRCQGHEGDAGDPTGDDRSNAGRARDCRSDRENDNSGDNQAGDNQSGDSRDEQDGDNNNSGDNGDGGD